MNGIFFGSHNITMLVFRCKLKKVLRLFMSVMDSFWLLCGDASSALFTAATEGSIKMTKFFERVVRLSRKQVSTSIPVWRAQGDVSASVTDLPNTLLACLCSFPPWYSIAKVAPSCFSFARPLLERVPMQKILIIESSVQAATSALVITS